MAGHAAGGSLKISGLDACVGGATGDSGAAHAVERGGGESRARESGRDGKEGVGRSMARMSGGRVGVRGAVADS